MWKQGDRQVKLVFQLICVSLCNYINSFNSVLEIFLKGKVMVYVTKALIGHWQWNQVMCCVILKGLLLLCNFIKNLQKLTEFKMITCSYISGSVKHSAQTTVELYTLILFSGQIKDLEKYERNNCNCWLVLCTLTFFMNMFKSDHNKTCTINFVFVNCVIFITLQFCSSWCCALWSSKTSDT